MPPQDPVANIDGLTPIPALRDNYVWAVHTDDACLLVDPGESGGALEFLRRERLALAGILLTHHHPDHVGGVAGILAEHPAPVWGPDDTRIPVTIRTVAEGDRVEVLGMTFQVLATPAHTRTHIAFHGHGLLFSGDTLFACGCGKLFEGTPAQMLESLDKLAALPDATRVCCGHEYTLANCRFAARVEPDNPDLAGRLERVAALRDAGRVTLPSTLAEEKATNPFLRVREPAVIAAARQFDPECGDEPAAVLGAIRAWKDAG